MHSGQLLLIKPGYLKSVPRPGVNLLSPFWKLQEQLNIYYVPAIVDNLMKFTIAVLGLPWMGRLKARLVALGWVPDCGAPGYVGLHVLTRVGALPPGGALLVMAFFVMFIILAVAATILTFRLYLLVLPLDLVGAVAWALFAWPILSSGVADHNMLDYHVAMENSVPQDWEPGNTDRSA